MREITHIVKNLTDTAMNKLSLAERNHSADMGPEFPCNPYKDGLPEICSQILAGMIESGTPTVRGMTDIYTSQVRRAFVCYFSNSIALLTHVCLVPCCDPWIFSALITFHIIVNNQSL